MINGIRFVINLDITKVYYLKLKLMGRYSVRPYPSPPPHVFCMRLRFYRWYLYLFTHTDVQHEFHIAWISCRLSVTWRVPLMEQELYSTGAPDFYPTCCGVRVAQYLAFPVMLCKWLLVLFFLYLLPLCCLSFNLQLLITPFGIFRFLYCWYKRRS